MIRSHVMKRMMSAALLFSCIACVYACGEEEDAQSEPVLTSVENHGTTLVFNPYEGIDWDTVRAYLTNLHTHTTASPCGQSAPHDVVDYYAQWGYDILAITDHDRITYPWSFSDIDPAWEDRDPEEMGILAIKGNEFTNASSYHDMVGLFTDHHASDEDADLEETLAHVAGEENAVVFFAHPGRYWQIFTDYADDDVFSPAWYLDHFNRFPSDTLVGLEVFSRNNRHPYDTVLWDLLLEQSMPERPIFGLGNDDYHGNRADRGINFSFTWQLMEGPATVEALRASLIAGTYFTSHTTQEDHSAPHINAVRVDTRRATIEIEAEDYAVIRWISGTTRREVNGITLTEHRIVGTGHIFEYGDFEGNYVRAEIVKVPVFTEAGRQTASASVTLTQPFGFSRAEDDE